jgi:voltage-gated sodium channel
MVTVLRQIANSSRFSYFILAMIVLSSVLVGLETVPGFDVTEPFGRVVQFLQDVILYIFAIEQVIKIGAKGRQPWTYFQDPWNLFDFTIVVVCFLPLGAGYATVFRLARVLRALRLVSALPKLQLLVSALLKSLPSLGYVGILLFLLFYVYGVLGTFLFRANDPIHFGGLPQSMRTLFEVVTLEGWVQSMYIQMYGSDNFGYDEQMMAIAGAARRSDAHPYIAPVYFVSFILLGTMIILNLFIGIIINGMEEAQEEVEKERRKQHRKELGATTIGDELALICHELEALRERLHSLQGQTQEIKFDQPPLVSELLA